MIPMRAAVRRMIPRLSCVAVRMSAACAAQPIIQDFVSNNKTKAYLSSLLKICPSALARPLLQARVEGE